MRLFIDRYNLCLMIHQFHHDHCRTCIILFRFCDRSCDHIRLCTFLSFYSGLFNVDRTIARTGCCADTCYKSCIFPVSEYCYVFQLYRKISLTKAVTTKKETGHIFLYILFLYDIPYKLCNDCLNPSA